MKWQILRLKELDESGELVSCTPLDIVNDLATSQEIMTSKHCCAVKKQAKFYYPFADLADVIPKAERHVNIPLVERLESGEYIKNGRNILIISETGGVRRFLAVHSATEPVNSSTKSVISTRLISWMNAARHRIKANTSNF